MQSIKKEEKTNCYCCDNKLIEWSDQDKKYLCLECIVEIQQLASIN